MRPMGQGEIDPRLLSDDDLLAAAGRGETRALSEIVERYRPMVARIARRLHGQGGSEDVEDLIQVGMIGLLEAAGRFDPVRGSFPSYAAATISGTIKRHFRDRGWRLRIPRSLHDAVADIRARGAELESRLGREPSEEELALATGLDLELVREGRELIGGAKVVSLSAPVGGEDGSSELAELIGEEDPNLHRAELRGLIGRLSSDLEPDDRELLARRFGLGQTQVEIADGLGGSQMRVSRRLRSVLGRMGRAAGARPPVE